MFNTSTSCWKGDECDRERSNQEDLFKEGPVVTSSKLKAAVKALAEVAAEFTLPTALAYVDGQARQSTRTIYLPRSAYTWKI